MVANIAKSANQMPAKTGFIEDFLDESELLIM